MGEMGAGQSRHQAGVGRGAQKAIGSLPIASDAVGEGVAIEWSVSEVISDVETCQRSDDLAEPIAFDHLREVHAPHIGRHIIHFGAPVGTRSPIKAGRLRHRERP